MMASRRESSWDLRNLLQGFHCGSSPPVMQVEGICSDSRRVQPGDVFFAIPGVTSNGIDYAASALQGGAVAVIYDASDDYSLERVQLLQKQLPALWLGVDNLARCAGEIASRFHGYPSRHMMTIGVTGTDGKSSVTHMLVQALGLLGKRTGSIGTLGAGVANEFSAPTLTTPMAFDVQRNLADFRRQGCQVVVMEVSSHALHQYRVAGCEFDQGILTNLGRDHLDYHGDMASYADAKARLFTEFPLRASILNLDDDFGRQLLGRQQVSGVMTYSATGKPEADVSLVNDELLADGFRLTVRVKDKELTFNSHLLGRFNIDNMLACFASLLELGYEPPQIATVLSELRAIPGRMECFSGHPGRAMVVVDFAHTDQALRACLQASRLHCSGRLWCVFGCGGDRDSGKRPLMGAVAEQLADCLIITDDNPRTEDPQAIVDDILSGISDTDTVQVIHDRRQAIDYALNAAKPGDLLVIAGKGHEEEQIIGSERLAFSDRLVVREMLEADDD